MPPEKLSYRTGLDTDAQAGLQSSEPIPNLVILKAELTESAPLGRCQWPSSPTALPLKKGGASLEMATE